MSIYDLRKNVEVLSFTKGDHGVSIHYQNGGNLNFITLGPDEVFKELVSIGTYEDNYHDHTEFDDSTCISQWDALNIVIRFELAREIEKEIKNSDLGKSIENLLNKQS